MINRAAMEAALRRELTSHGPAHPTYAAVIPVVWAGKYVYLPVEVRAAGISQAGDPCFPGGRIEPGETPEQAALRELYEELGIRVKPSAILGRIPTVHTPLGDRTVILVCSVSKQAALNQQPNPAEVARVLWVPLNWLQERPNASSFLFLGHEIWGMTAGAIRHFLRAWERAEQA